MPARDLYHNTVVNALVKDGWKIADDPLHLTYGQRELYVDLGAEHPLAAEKAGRKIAVEIKSFIGPSNLRELEVAIGQYVLYREILAQQQPERQMYLAVSLGAYEDVFTDPLGQLAVESQELRLIVFDEQLERIAQWIP
ncbi:MAG: element excision factor XisH family protein [Chloroflexota bacterium]